MLDTIPPGFVRDSFIRGMDEGVVIGRDEGIVIGRDEEKAEIARHMKQKGYSAEVIADLTGLSLDDIERLEGTT